jgi:tetratricopeptide (TPR) repeat protein
MVCLSFVPTLTFAQEPTDQPEAEYATPSDEERRLNDEAARAIGEGDYTKAISYLQEALYLGELNVTFLNLGRAYQYMGRCEEARAALDKVSEAPAVRKPAPKFVEKKAAEFLAELDEECRLHPEAPAAGGTEIAGHEPSEVEPPGVSPTSGQTSGRDALGWTSLGGGAVLVGGGIGLGFWAESLRDEVGEPTDVDAQGRVLRPTQATVQDNYDNADTLDTLGLSMGILGGAAVITGVYLLLTDDDPEQASISVGPNVGANSGKVTSGVVISGTF